MRVALVAARFIGSLVAFASSGNLDRDTISATGSGLDPALATIGAGVEFVGIGGFLKFDSGASERPGPRGTQAQRGALRRGKP